MSVLNQASDGIYTVLIVLVRALVRLGPMAREDLLSTCGADLDGVVDSGHLTRTVNRWTDLGLFATHSSGVALAAPYSDSLGKTPESAEVLLPGVARAIILSSNNNDRFWEATDNMSADLSRGMAWLLAQDIYELDTNTATTIANLEIAQLMDPTCCIFQNDTRLNGLRAWMPYLGFARAGTHMAIDPTVAVREALPEVFATATTLTARQFIDALAQSLPVLDRGVYRAEVEKRLDPAKWRRPLEGQLSMSLSRALQRLDYEGQIALGRGADAKEGVTLTGFRGRIWRQVTDIRRVEQKGTKR